MTFDPSGKLWATSCLGLGNSAGPVVAFSSTANGSSVPPLITIGGAATGLSDCQLGIVVDASGNVYVADNTNAPPQFPGGQVAIFASGQRGNVAPANRIAGTSANFHSPGGLALDAGGNLFVVDTGQGFASFPGDVQVFAPGASGNAAPIRAIAGNNTLLSQPFGIAFDQVGNLYVTNVGSNSITVYAAGAAGNVSPMRVITGPNTRLSLPTGIAVDNAGYAYVGNENQSPPNSPILVFAPNANGNVAPVAATTVNAQRFAEPSGIALR
jgi:sugar lactone lactonase YvrE